MKRESPGRSKIVGRTVLSSEKTGRRTIIVYDQLRQNLEQRRSAVPGLESGEIRALYLKENALENCLTPVAMSDMEGRITYINQACTRMWGGDRSELIGRKYWELLGAAEVEVLDKVVNAMIEKGSFEDDLLVNDRLGEERYLHILTSLVRDEYGNPVQTISSIVDNTERRRAEEALRESESRYRLLAENITDVIWVMDVNDLRLTYVSPSVTKQRGYTVGEASSQKIEDMMPPDSLGIVTEALGEGLEMEMKGLNEGGTWWRVDHKMYCKDGSTIWVETNASFIRDPDGKAIAILGLSREITERKSTEEALKQSEQHYAALVGNLTEAVFQFKAGKIVWCNDRVQEIYGYPKKELIGKTVDFFFPPGTNVPEFFGAVSKAVKHKGFFRDKAKFRKKGGDIVDIDYSITQIPGRDPLEVVAVARDITELVQTEEEVRRLNAELEQRVQERTMQLQAVNNELEAFAYSVSHDLRAPLRSINGFSQALVEDYTDRLDEEGRDALIRVRAASERMGQLIDDILNLSRITRSEMVREKVDLSSIAESIANDLKAASPERNAEFEITPGLEARGDTRLLRVALDNLIGNAWKFTGTRQLARIEFGRTTIEGRKVFYVKDNGVGFNMAYSDKLFRPFQRLHSTDEFEGTGIGLATVQRIINRHGGTIWVESSEGQGTTFYFVI